MSSLPEVIIFDILTRLPVKSLVRFRCVCKPWGKLFSDPEFVNVHLNRSIKKNNPSLMFIGSDRIYTVDYNDLSSSASCNEAVEIVNFPFKSLGHEIEVLGSSNGLLSILVDEFLCIWNPSTTEFKKLPRPPRKYPRVFGIRYGAFSYGFGYCCKIDDYKLVRVLGTGEDGYEFQVYTLGTNSWKRIRNIPYQLTYQGQPGVLLNGSLHWIANVPSQGFSNAILSFSISDERFEEVPEPKHLTSELYKNISVLGGCLCLVGNNLYMDHAEVWVMKEYGVPESWTKLFNVPQQPLVTASIYSRPIKSFNNGEILLEKCVKTLVVYDSKHKQFRVPNIRGVPEWFKAESYVESLVSPNSSSYAVQEDNKGRKRKHEDNIKKKPKKRKVFTKKNFYLKKKTKN